MAFEYKDVTVYGRNEYEACQAEFSTVDEHRDNGWRCFNKHTSHLDGGGTEITLNFQRDLK